MLYRDRSSCIWQDRTKPYTINKYHNLLYSWDMQMQWFILFPVVYVQAEQPVPSTKVKASW